MAQAITDVKTFLEDARQAVVELAEFEKQAESGGRCREFDREKAPG